MCCVPSMPVSVPQCSACAVYPACHAPSGPPLELGRVPVLPCVNIEPFSVALVTHVCNARRKSRASGMFLPCPALSHVLAGHDRGQGSHHRCGGHPRRDRAHPAPQADPALHQPEPLQGWACLRWWVLRRGVCCFWSPRRSLVLLMCAYACVCSALACVAYVGVTHSGSSLHPSPGKKGER
jgi:hypothetical protein